MALPTQPFELTARQAWDLLSRRKLSARELAESVLRRMEEVESHIHAYVKVTADLALEQAARIDERRASGEELGPLAGVPIALKDIVCTRGIATTCCSKILENFVPPYDATVVERLRDAGTVWLGKTNMDEFAMGSSTEHSAFGPTHNPWDIDRVPGGSSGGSAAAVAAHAAAIALGTDTGGSVRQPAALCGVVGMKPTYGRVSRYGLIAYASSLDQIGPITKDVADCALLMNLMCGHDPRDSTSAPVQVPDFSSFLGLEVKGLRIGVPREFFEYEGASIERPVDEAVRRAISLLENMGAEVREISLPHISYSIPVYYLIAPAEASSNLARYDGVAYGFRTRSPHSDVIQMYCRTRSEGFGAEVKRRIMLGTYALSAGYYDAYYQKAQQVRTLVKRDFDSALQQVDLLAAPTSPCAAFRLGEKMEDPLSMYLSDVCTIPVNLAGLPGVSIPCGFSDGLPIGLQLIGRPFDEGTLLRVAYAFEQATDYHRRKPVPPTRSEKTGRTSVVTLGRPLGQDRADSSGGSR
jgi:aspartyl-tRNA(Asn)/glutamyl-tRNA(Gln) amidotransferase subunit A